jgi:predicted transcriptional regulator
MTSESFALVRQRRQEVEKAQARLRAAIIAAYESRGGRTVSELADAAGLSRPRIYQIVSEHKTEGTHGR